MNMTFKPTNQPCLLLDPCVSKHVESSLHCAVSTLQRSCEVTQGFAPRITKGCEKAVRVWTSQGKALGERGWRTTLSPRAYRRLGHTREGCSEAGWTIILIIGSILLTKFSCLSGLTRSTNLAWHQLLDTSLASQCVQSKSDVNGNSTVSNFCLRWLSDFVKSLGETVVGVGQILGEKLW